MVAEGHASRQDGQQFFQVDLVLYEASKSCPVVFVQAIIPMTLNEVDNNLLRHRSDRRRAEVCGDSGSYQNGEASNLKELVHCLHEPAINIVASSSV
jgi:hypothetical protein